MSLTVVPRPSRARVGSHDAAELIARIGRTRASRHGSDSARLVHMNVTPLNEAVERNARSLS